jgi:hypothetical protein
MVGNSVYAGRLSESGYSDDAMMARDLDILIGQEELTTVQGQQLTIGMKILNHTTQVALSAELKQSV